MRRSGGAELTDARLAAMAAARDAGLPVPRLIARTDVAVLLTWLPGRRMLDVLGTSPGAATAWGRRSGELHRRLHQVVAPPTVASVLTDGGHPFGAGREVPGVPDGDRLLHLDWHPLNLLVDDARGEICGIVDWDNARRGSPFLDIARTDAILTLEPSLEDLPTAVRRALPDFHAGWLDGYGAVASDLPRPCRRWAARVMLADLEPRYAGRPTALDRLRAAVLG
jgi:Ser/Thr protein kinase RdoA (MazF antagonist)